MTLEEFINKVIERGIQAAKKDYADRSYMLKGAVAGFEACRGKTPDQLQTLLKEASEQMLSLYDKESLSNYWEKACYRAEIDYVLKSVACYYVLIGEDGAYGPLYRHMATSATMLSSHCIFQEGA